MRYYLMHENVKVAMLELDGAGQIVRAGIGKNELANSLVPVGIPYFGKRCDKQPIGD